MDTDLEEWCYQEYGWSPKARRDPLPSWGPLAVLITGLERLPLDGWLRAPAQAEGAACQSVPQPKPSWYRRSCTAAGRGLIALGRRLESWSGFQTIT